jgi:hypothetical protein
MRFLLEAKASTRLIPEIAPLQSDSLVGWYQSHRPDALIFPDVWYKQTLNFLNLRIPEDCAVVSLSLDSRESPHTGIHQHPRAIGASALNKLDSCIRNRELGQASPSEAVLVSGSWNPGTSAPEKKPEA